MEMKINSLGTVPYLFQIGLYIYIYIYTCKLYKLINLCWSTGQQGQQGTVPIAASSV